MHLVLEELKSIPSFGLNTIEGKIGFMEQSRSGVSMRGGKRYPDAQSDRNLLALDRKRFGDAFEQGCR
jgi:hypothetical protein